MTAFLLLCALMVGTALVFVLAPMLRAPRQPLEDHGIGMRVYRSQLRELESDVRLGLLDATQVGDAQRDIQRRVLDEAAAPAPALAHGMRGSTRLVVLAILLALPLTAGALYWTLGTPDAVRNPAPAADASPHEPHARSADTLDVLAARLAKRLESEPRDGEGWALLGRTYGVLGRNPEAVAAFEKAVALLPNDAQLRAELDQARTGQPAAKATASVSGRVRLAGKLAQQAAPDDTVFIFARAPSGPRAPVAMITAKVRELPLDFVLDDSTAMMPDVRISSLDRVVVVARVSKSGDARPGPGDLEGTVGPLAVGSKGVNVRIERAVQ